MRLVICAVFVLFAGQAFSCGGVVALTVSNTHHGLPETMIFLRPQDTDSDQGYIIADLHADADGQVMDIEIIEVVPANLDTGVISKYLKKAKLPVKSKEYTKRLRYEFTILQTSS